MLYSFFVFFSFLLVIYCILASKRDGKEAVMNKYVKRGSAIYMILLVAFTVYLILDAFVIKRTYSSVDKDSEAFGSEDVTLDTENAQVDEDSFADGENSIEISEYRIDDTTVYVADIYLSSPEGLKTAFADDTYGKNITDKTSVIAEENNALLAINGDYYSARSGYVIRNGVIYSNKSEDDEQSDLVVYEDGSMAIVTEGSTTAEELLENGAVQVFCFGPGLVSGHRVIVDEDDEVDQHMSSNPRTAIGWISDTHYVMVVSDGRTNESQGLSLRELADFMKGLGCDVAYNLDGGGSSTMYYNGEVVNNPTTNGNKITERKVSDIVYIS